MSLFYQLLQINSGITISLPNVNFFIGKENHNPTTKINNICTWGGLSNLLIYTNYVSSINTANFDMFKKKLLFINVYVVPFKVITNR